MLKTPSVIRNRQPLAFFWRAAANLRAAAAASLWAKGISRAREAWQPSKMLAWFSRSQTMISWGVSIQAMAPRLVVKPVAWTTAFFLPTKAARRSSRVLMQGQVAAQESGSPGSTPPAQRRLGRRLDYSGIMGESQVIIGPNHNQTPARHLHFCAPRSVYGPEVRVKPLFPGVLDHKSKRLAAVFKCHKRILPLPLR